MTAGTSSCSCEVCGTVCTGRFEGCAGVWDKALRQEVVSGPRGSDRLEAPPAGRDREAEPPARHDEPVLSPDMADGTGMSVVLAHLFERVEALERAATAAPRQDVQLRLVEELAQRTVDELDQHRARTIERLDELAGSVTALGELPQRVAALEWVDEGTTAIHHALTELGRGLDRLSAVPERVEALERTADEAIDAIEQRLGGMEKAVADLGRGLEDMAAEVARLGELPRRVEALEQADEPASAEALTAVQARLDQLCERADGMEPLPQRVDALERAAFGGGPVHHRSRSMVADLDALEAQVAVVATAVDGVPRRLADVERASARTEALERGLAGAVEVIDQLVAQLAALEWACRPLPPPDEDG